MTLISELSLNMLMGKEVETDPVLKESNLFLKGRRDIKGFPSRKKGLLTNSIRLYLLFEATTSLCEGKRKQQSFEESKGEDSKKMFKIFIVDEEVVSSKDDSPFAVTKVFLRFRKKIVTNPCLMDLRFVSTFSLIFPKSIQLFRYKYIW